MTKTGDAREGRKEEEGGRLSKGQSSKEEKRVGGNGGNDRESAPPSMPVREAEGCEPAILPGCSRLPLPT